MTHRKRIWKIILPAALAFLALVLIWAKLRTEQAARQLPETKIHYAGNPQVQLDQVFIQAVYFVPKDAQALPEEEWKPQLAEALKQTSGFYSSQLENKIKIDYQIIPEPVQGLMDTLGYDGTSTNKGNPRALLAAGAELKKRLLSEGGDLYNKNSVAGGRFTVLAVLYEGVGSAGWLEEDNGSALNESLVNQGFPSFLISRDFLTAEEYQDYGITFFAHELGHAFGLKDNYSAQTGLATSDDIMGSGRFRPLQYTYLSVEDKKMLGIEN